MIGEKLGSYRIVGPLGVGAMGVVYRAVHEKTNRPAAVKVISGEIATKGNAYERFEREADITQQFRHPNIVRFLARGRYQGTLYFAMEFIKGQTLEEILKEKGPLPWKDVVEIGVQLAEALQYAHDHGVVHRDLKPSNLMINDSGAVKLTDFGIAKDLDATALTATGRTLGTAAYMAPEQIRGTPEISHKTDLYALGILFYQMLTDQLPFEGSSPVVMMHGHLNGPVPRASDKLAEIPKDLDNLVFQLMAKEPSDRTWDAAAVADKLKAIRDKTNKGEKVKMVWPAEADGANGGSSPTSPGSLPTIAPRKIKKKSGKPRQSSDSSPEFSEVGTTRRRLETAGLVLALLAIAALIGYRFIPEGRESIYEHAKELMKSDKRHDWVTAREDYIEPLEKRFPDHPYKEEIKGWRDKVLLADAKGRAGALLSSLPSLNQPKNPTEQNFVLYNSDAAAARKEGDDPRAADLFDEFVGKLKPDDPIVDRQWWLYVREFSAAIRREIKVRDEMIQSTWVRATSASKEGQTGRAAEMYNEAVEKYGKYADGRRKFLELGPVPGIPPHPKLFGTVVVPQPTPAPPPGDPATPAVAPLGEPKAGVAP